MGANREVSSLVNDMRTSSFNAQSTKATRQCWEGKKEGKKKEEPRTLWNRFHLLHVGGSYESFTQSSPCFSCFPEDEKLGVQGGKKGKKFKRRRQRRHLWPGRDQTECDE